MATPRNYGLLVVTAAIAAIVISAALIASPALSATTTSTRAAQISTTSAAVTESTTNTRITTRPTNLCISPGQPKGVFFRVLNDSTSRPVVGANVIAIEDGYSGNCGNPAASAFTWQDTEVFTTNNTEWHSLTALNSVDYRLTVTYLGHAYSFVIAPPGLSIYTCGTLYLPSGKTDIITSAQTSCASSAQT
jgi:hypothetical protein